MTQYLEISEVKYTAPADPTQAAGQSTCEATRYNVNDDSTIVIKSWERHTALGDITAPDAAVAFGQSLVEQGDDIKVVYAEHQNPGVAEICIRDFGKVLLA